MSTYLACFIVCDFDHLETRYTNSNIPITVYARKEYISDVKFALDAALQFTDFYCNYFDIAYPLSKLGEYISKYFFFSFLLFQN